MAEGGGGGWERARRLKSGGTPMADRESNQISPVRVWLGELEPRAPRVEQPPNDLRSDRAM